MTAASGTSDLGEADRRVLGFAASQAMITTGQAASLLGERAAGRLVALASAGVLARMHCGGGGPTAFRITGAGLDHLGRGLELPRFEPRMRSAVGVGWLWLAARAGALGRADEVLSQEEMRRQDRNRGSGAPFAVRPELFGGDAAAHYPDLVLISGSERVVVEMLLAPAPARRVEAVLRAYAADARVKSVLCLVEDVRLAGPVLSAGERLELTAMVHVQRAAISFG